MIDRRYETTIPMSRGAFFLGMTDLLAAGVATGLETKMPKGATDEEIKVLIVRLLGKMEKMLEAKMRDGDDSALCALTICRFMNEFSSDLREEEP
jgi:hypothetical protein